MAAGTNSKPFIPDFLFRLGINTAEWMFTSKPALRVLVRPNQPRKVRIFGCLLLQSFGYEADLALVMSKTDKNKPVRVAPITPGGISSMLNRETAAAFKDAGITLSDDQRASIQVSPAHMRRDLADMEDDGILSRVRLNVPWEKLKRRCTGLQKTSGWKSLGEALEEDLVTDFQDLPLKERQMCANGKVAVYLHARPRACKNLSVEGMETAEGSNMGVDHFTQMLFNFVRSLRKSPKLAAELAARDDVRERLQSYEANVASEKANLLDYLGTLLTASSTIDASVPVANTGYCPPPISNKSQDRGIANQQKSTRDQGRQAGIPAPERDRAGRPAPPQVSAANPNGRGKGHPTGSQEPDTIPPAAAAEKLSDAEVYTVLEAMHQFALADDEAAALLIRKCRENAPECTAVQIAEAVNLKGKAARGKESPVGYLIACVEKVFKGQTPKVIKDAENVIVGAFSGERKKVESADTLDQLTDEFHEWKAKRAAK